MLDTKNKVFTGKTISWCMQFTMYEMIQDIHHNLLSILIIASIISLNTSQDKLFSSNTNIVPLDAAKTNVL